MENVTSTTASTRLLNMSHNETWPHNYDNMSDYYDGHGQLSDSELREMMFLHYLFNYVAPSVFGIITIVGTLGNSLVIYTIFSRKNMMTVTNILLLNLAFADILFLIICGSFTAYKYAAFGAWGLGDAFCKFMQYCMYVTSYVTVYTLVAVSGLRFLTVVYNTSTVKYRTKSNAVLLNIFIWVTVLLFNIPTFLVHRLKGNPNFVYCGMETDAVGPVFITFFVFAYVLPLTVICNLYLLILCHLQQAKRASLVQSSGQAGRTTRACKVIVLVVVMFGVAWLPLHINSLVARYGSLSYGTGYMVLLILWNAMAYSNSCVNPLIYNYFSQDFKKAFKEVICRGMSKRPMRHRPSDRINETETLTIAGGQTLTTL